MRLSEVVHAIVLFLTLVKSAISVNVVRITNESGFKDFVKNVNSGANYSGTTVYLSSDLSFSENTLEPIGKDTNNYFRGTFDGQGYIISNFTMNMSTSKYAGLFGFSYRLTIRNVVLDDSCSITSFYSRSNYNVFVGGIIGEWIATNNECNIENSVNMANVIFSGNINGYNLFLGGIAGRLQASSPSSGYDIYVKNCANYGSVTHSGTNYDSYIGGIVGYYRSSYVDRYVYLQNCLNHGTITHSGTTSNDLDLGGITGYTGYAKLHNCLSIGAISTPSTAPSSDYRGAIVGYVNLYTYLSYCYFTKDVEINSYYGYINYSPSLDHMSNSPTAISDAISNLSSYYSGSGWSKWLLNENNATVTFKISKGKDFSFSSKIILVPEPVEEGNTFLFWCKDAECAEEFNITTDNISGNTTLYAGWVNNTVTFDFGNGTTVNATFAYNTEIKYPVIEREGYTFSRWDNYRGLMPARDIIVTAQWTPNNYTVTFDVNGGNVSGASKIIVTFADKYGGLPEPTKEGYMFIGWFTNETNGTEVTNETTVIIPSNHTLYARWEETTAQVEVVFSKKDLTKKEIEKIIKQYTKAEFEIAKFEESSESGEISVIIKFADKDDAKEFVGEINKSGGGDVIKEVKFVFGDGSFSATTYPLSFLNTLFL